MSEHEDMMERLETADTVPPPTPPTPLTREQVLTQFRPNVNEDGTYLGMMTTREGGWVLFEHAEELRQSLAQQAQEVDIVSADLSEARHQIGLLQQRIDTHCMTEAELRQQVATMETNAADNGALFRAVLNEKLTLAQEVERLKEKYETATKFIASLGQERDDAVAQRAAMTAERDEWQNSCEQSRDLVACLRAELAASQARVKELERAHFAELKEKLRYTGEYRDAKLKIEQLQATLAEREEQLRLANMDQANTEAALNDARQDAARLREALEALWRLTASHKIADPDAHAIIQRALKGA